MDTLSAVREAQRPIEEIFRGWLSTGAADLARLERLHAAAAVALHRHYAQHIPVYRRLSESSGLARCEDARTLWSELSSTDDLFKSYSPAWLDAGDFTSMTGWIDDVSGRRVSLDAARLGGIGTIDDWIGALEEQGLFIKYSSGTSGHFSFVPRDAETERNNVSNTMLHVGALLRRHEIDLREYDGFILSFRGGRLGLAAVGEKLGQITRAQEFLFDFPIDAQLVRALLRGASSPEQQAALDAFRERTVGGREAAYARVAEALRRSAQRGGRALLLGTPFQVLELCRLLERQGERLALDPRSFVALGGGWKSVSAERIPRADLEALIGDRLGLPPGRVTESYSMIECNIGCQRCPEGRFHVPPLIRPMIFDERLYPVEGDEGVGRFAFSDPFATSYAGFFVTGDLVHLTAEPCRCGAAGYSIVGEISRAASQETKGCGAVMGSFRA